MTNHIEVIIINTIINYNLNYFHRNVIKEADEEGKKFLRRKFELLYGRARFFQLWHYRTEIKLLGMAQRLVDMAFSKLTLTLT
jgi:hypothetical protein